MSKKEIGECFGCNCCGKYQHKGYMAYIKPEMERDVFPDIGSLCRKCIKLELGKLTMNIVIPPRTKYEAKWLFNNVFQKFPNNPNVEEIIFLSKIIIEN